MTAELDDLLVTVTPDTTIDATVRRLAARSKHVVHAGIAAVLGPRNELLGVLSDGDIRRAYAADVDFSGAVTSIMVDDPVTVLSEVPISHVLNEVHRQSKAIDRLTTGSVPHVMVTNNQGQLVDVYNTAALDRLQNDRDGRAAIVGLGYVGITLAATLALSGKKVVGIDVDADLIQSLEQGECHVLEPGLNKVIKNVTQTHHLAFYKTLPECEIDVYVFAVGTPCDENGYPDLTALISVATSIAERLKPGDLVMVRSTVPVGATRHSVIPALESNTKLRAGRDFHVAFVPERTAEGQAMRELRTLPQIVSGLTPTCVQAAETFWRRVSPSIIRVESLEAAEIVKLTNNTFRDLSFAFANELAMIADEHNIDANVLVNAANDGYPRNRIPSPSPGVGGPCLTKDPLLFGNRVLDGARQAKLGMLGRQINVEAGQYPIEILRRFADKVDRSLDSLNVLVVGVAFKGVPETNDVRGSVALDVAKQLQQIGATVFFWDAVIRGQDVDGIQRLNPEDDLRDIDAVLIMNNHPHNVDDGFLQRPADGRYRLLFDGWSVFDRREVESCEGMIYASMGYMSAGP